MCPAIRFGRFRRLEHQISWPYTGKIGIKTACRHGKSWVVLHSQTPSLIYAEGCLDGQVYLSGIKRLANISERPRAFGPSQKVFSLFIGQIDHRNIETLPHLVGDFRAVHFSRKSQGDKGHVWMQCRRFLKCLLTGRPDGTYRIAETPELFFKSLNGKFLVSNDQYLCFCHGNRISLQLLLRSRQILEPSTPECSVKPIPGVRERELCHWGRYRTAPRTVPISLACSASSLPTCGSSPPP